MAWVALVLRMSCVNTGNPPTASLGCTLVALWVVHSELLGVEWEGRENICYRLKGSSLGVVFEIFSYPNTQAFSPCFKLLNTLQGPLGNHWQDFLRSVHRT